MTVLILLLCTVAALFIHRTFIRPILDWFEQREYAERMREAERIFNQAGVECLFTMD